MTLESILAEVVRNGPWAALSAYLLWRNRELQQTIEDSLEDSSEAIRGNTEALTSLTEWLRARLSRGVDP